jgi:hypothetical protein
MGIETRGFGVRREAMELQPKQPPPMGEVIHRRAEPEIAFLLEGQLCGPGVIVREVHHATSAFCGTIEVTDSRYACVRFAPSEVVAKNTSAARFVLETTVLSPGSVHLPLPGSVVLPLLGIELKKSRPGRGDSDRHGGSRSSGSGRRAHRERDGPQLRDGRIGHLPSGGGTDMELLASGVKLTVSLPDVGRVDLRDE